MTISLKFLGAFDSVTGSKTLVKHGSKRYLVDCGIFQGPPELRNRNRESLEIPAKDIDAVFLTHAHLDHCGYLPRLCKEGFRGPIYCSQGTYQLADIILQDSAHLEEETARFARKTGYSRHADPSPLFTSEDVEQVMTQFRILERNKWHDLGNGLSLYLSRSGHLIGSSFLRFRFGMGDESRTITFSGDLGNYRSAILKGPENIDEPDTLVLESTYGQRIHAPESSLVQLGTCLSRVIARKGIAVIPAFAVGRSQEIMYLIGELERLGSIPQVPVLLDSPMSRKALNVFLDRNEDQILNSGFGPTTEQFYPRNFQAVESVDDSMLATMMDGPAIIISASGMLSGGRILHHLKHRLPDPRNMVIFSGYQALGSKGRFLQEQAKILGKMRIHHQEVSVEAEIATIDSLSSHADYSEIVSWLNGNRSLSQHILLNHGEPEAQQHLATILRESLKTRVSESCVQQEWYL